MLLTTGLIGCSSPNVKYTLAEEGRVGSVEHWTIELIDPLADADPLLLEKAGVATRSQYDQREKAQKFLGDVRQKLIRNHGLSFAENYPTRGRISVSLRGSKALRILVPPKDDDPLKADLYHSLAEPSSSHPADSVGGEYWVGGSYDQVVHARVDVFDVDGKLTGSIELTGTTKPKHVAVAISEYLKKIAVK
ncbi:MAG: hypothetical protein KKA42_09645 [candidate division Zixibacteria bacterium]|nr:hypothetical protein [candidate division Zixibacteria bacterium]